MNSSQRGDLQTAYQIIVASTRSLLREGRPDLWDSGKVVSDQCLDIPYDGRELVSHSTCFWSVRIWDKSGKPSAWSEPAQWSMGILETHEWRGEWIGKDAPEQTVYLKNTSWIWGAYPLNNGAQTNWFRRVITLPAERKIKRATFEYTGDDECRGWLEIFDLGARNNPKVVKWNDITGRLESGHTYVFGLVGRVREGGPAGVIGLVRIDFEEGEPMLVPTDASWKVSNTYSPEWNDARFNDSTWVPAQVLPSQATQQWGYPRTAEERQLPAHWLRKTFELSKPVQRATVSLSGLGSSELYVNGRKAGDHVLSPALSQYNKRVYYVTHDVTGPLRKGPNAIGVVLGGGRFYSDRSKVYTGTVNAGAPRLLLQLTIEHPDGTKSHIQSDPSWRLTAGGPILSSGEYDGEEYDARKQLAGWSQPGFVDKAWEPVQIMDPPAPVVSAQMQFPIRVTGILKPVRITEPQPGIFIFDMGQNMVGWCRLKVKGPAGAQVRLRHAETLKTDGSLNTANLRSAQATDIYTLKGGGTEVYEPRFTYHGFRYVEVTGYPGKPGMDSIRACVVNDDLPLTGEFTCSNTLLNRTYRNAVWGIRGNYRSIPTDCPQRDERQGWLGDRSEECGGEAYIFDVQAFYDKWLRDIADAQKPGGSVPDIAPAYWPIYSDNVTWPSTLIILPGIMHGHYSDRDGVQARFDNADRWLGHMRSFFTNGIILRDSYGDWCVPPEDLRFIHSKDPARQTDKGFLASSYFYRDLTLMEKYARLLSRPDDAAKYKEMAQELKAAFNKHYWNSEKGYYDNGSQTTCVLGLAFDLVPDGQRERVFQHLVEKIENESKSHVGTGLIGGQYLMRVLSDNGRPDLAYTIATQPDYPGWGYMVNQGATTIWELWNGNTADPTMNSGNHVMLLGDLVVWMYEYLAGIRPEVEQSGFKRMLLKPYPVGDLKNVRASHQTRYGLVKSSWTKSRDVFDWSVTVPPNTSAKVEVPLGPNKRVRIPKGSSSIVFIGQQGDRAVYEVTSGSYRFISE